MKKVNNNLMNVMKIFIVLLSSLIFISSYVIAAEGEPAGEPLIIPSGDGTADNPYVIDVTASNNGPFKFKAETVPFDFTVKEEGVYKVEYNTEDKVMTFTLISSGSSSARLAINRDKYANIDNWQLGIKTQKREYSTSMNPAYAIRELSSYTQDYDFLVSTSNVYRKSDGTITPYATLFEERGEGDYNGDGVVDGNDNVIYTSIVLGRIGKNNGIVVTRNMTLSNVTGESAGGYDVEENNLYYFTNINKRIRTIYIIRVPVRRKFETIFWSTRFIQ